MTLFIILLFGMLGLVAGGLMLKHAPDMPITRDDELHKQANRARPKMEKALEQRLNNQK